MRTAPSPGLSPATWKRLFPMTLLPIAILETEVIHGGDNPSPQASQVSTSRPRLGQSSHPPPGPSDWVGVMPRPLAHQSSSL